MTVVSYLRAQAFNNAWANHRLLSACARLSAQDLAAPRTGFFPSIIHTWNHILTVDWFYLGALESGAGDRGSFASEIPFPDFEGLDRAQRASDRRFIALLEEMVDDSLDETVDLPREDFIQTERKDRVLLHLLQHQIHHRGQIHAMLAETSAPPPQLDEFFLDHPYERGLRTQDFEALGFSEETIWC